MQWPIIPIKNLTSLFPLIFPSKLISLYALGRLKWILDIIWPLNQHSNLKNQRNRKKTSFNDKFFEWDYLHLTALMKETYFKNHRNSNDWEQTKCGVARQRSLVGRFFERIGWSSCSIDFWTGTFFKVHLLIQNS